MMSWLVQFPFFLGCLREFDWETIDIGKPDIGLSSPEDNSLCSWVISSRIEGSLFAEGSVVSNLVFGHHELLPVQIKNLAVLIARWVLELEEGGNWRVMGTGHLGDSHFRVGWAGIVSEAEIVFWDSSIIWGALGGFSEAESRFSVMIFSAAEMFIISALGSLSEEVTVSWGLIGSGAFALDGGRSCCVFGIWRASSKDAAMAVSIEAWAWVMVP